LTKVVDFNTDNITWKMWEDPYFHTGTKWRLVTSVNKSTFVWLTGGETGKTILAISELLKQVYGYCAPNNSGL